MEKPTDTGGAAFPMPAMAGWGGQTGMDLRDYFAGQAMVGLLSRDLEGNSLGNQHINHAQVKGRADPAWVAMKSYEIADAMLYERRAAE